MARFRRAPFLTCFYCGQRTTTRNDGQVRRFECRKCDATNYLDENGDITDPPISTTAATMTTTTRTPHFVTNPDPFPDELMMGGGGSSSFSPGSDGADSRRSGSQNVFCNTCLKNQHLFVASLAQYFPDDPDHPDTAALERRYFRFRQGLEQRYPQVCADCEPRVLERIRAAGYTAKTDHLRRMVDYSRRVRVTPRSWLDTADRLGRWLWWASLVLQVLWQVGCWARMGGGHFPAANVKESLPGESFSDDALVDDEPAPAAALGGIPPALQFVLHALGPRTPLLQSLCIGATLAGCWWNPYFVQTMRGFTKPLIGLSTWYAYQATAVVVRVALARLAGQEEGNATADAATAGAHAFALLFALYLHARAPRAIRKDMRPLFGKQPTALPLTPERVGQATQPLGGGGGGGGGAYQARRRSAGLEILSDVLDEISSSSPVHDHSASSPHQRKQSDATDGWDGWQPTYGMSTPGRTTRNALYNVDDDDDDDDDDVTPARAYTPRQQQQRYTLQQPQPYGGGDEMDWTPTRSDPVEPFSSSPSPAPRVSPPPHHRAFRAFDPAPAAAAAAHPRRAFGETPVTDDRGPFGYKVPPAPTSMAQRIFNRPNHQPRLVPRQASGGGSAGKTTQNAFFSGRAAAPAADDAAQQGSSSSSSSSNPFGRPAGTGLASSSSSVEFAQPSFFAEDILQRKRAMNGDGQGQRDDDDPGSFLSDLFSQTFTLANEEGDDADDDGSADASAGGARPRHRRGQSSSGGSLTAGRRGGAGVLLSSSLSLGRHLVQLAALLASSAVLYLQKEQQARDVEGLGDDTDDTALRLSRLPPRSTEALAVGVCMLVAAVLARESARRWRAVVTVRSSSSSSSSSVLLSGMGVVLGLASLAQAGWMAYGMYKQGTQQATADTTTDASSSYDYDDDDPLSALPPAGHGPWSAWQVAWLHGTVVAHEVWNLATRWA